MNNNFKSAFALIPLLLGIASSAWANSVPNGNFQQTMSDQLTGWTVGQTHPPVGIPVKGTVSGPKGGRFGVTEGAQGPGSHALCLQTGSEAGSYGLALSPRFPLVPGFEYEMSVKYRAEGLIPENPERTKLSAFFVDLFMVGQEKRLGSARLITSVNSEGWATLSKLSTYRTSFTVPEGTEWAQARPQVSNSYENAPATVWVGEISVLPRDPILPNQGFESGTEGQGPDRWTSYGSAQTAWVTDVARSGTHSVAVSDAPDGLFSGWSLVIPVRPDRSYRFNGYAKGGVLNPNGFIGGGALALLFLDRDGQPVGKPQVSKAVPAQTDWTEVSTPTAQAPAGAVSARLIAGLHYTNGTAWFDDLSLILDEVESIDVARVKRLNPEPSRAVTYAENLLVNGDVEAGNENQPTGWTYVGRSDANWSEAQIQQLHAHGRPKFSVGRGQGVWSRDMTYSGQGALLNVSVDPPLSKNHQWYGRNAVDGYWLSDPIACQPGSAYIASGWLRAGKPIIEAWFGPLEIRFYDAKGKQIPSADVRPGMGSVPSGQWRFYATMPYIAPKNAVTARLRFGQEFAADKGGWGRTYMDNLAVWELPVEVSLPGDQAFRSNDGAYRAWFEEATSKVKPPYLPAPRVAAAYESVWIRLDNLVPGNLYTDPEASIQTQIRLTNLLGEARETSIQVTRYDAKGKADAPIHFDGIQMDGGATVLVPVQLPPSEAYGAFYLEIEVLEGEAVVGQGNGRYAVLNSFSQKNDDPEAFPVTQDQRLGVTPLVPIFGDGRPFEQELGQVLQAGGFGLAWIRFYKIPLEEQALLEALEPIKQQLAWYDSLGIRSVVQLYESEILRPMQRDAYVQVGRVLGRELRGRAAAIGNWGIEKANSASPYRGGGSERITDTEYDTIMNAVYQGIKSEAPELTVLIGNIATDWDAKTIQRLYQKPADGQFDGAILNAYMGISKVIAKSLAEFDRHGDTEHTVWQEENADQRSPYEGDTRRYGEIGGAEQMVRTWLTLFGRFTPRLEAMTIWGFVRGIEQDVMMVTPTLQPRPQFVAHSLMASALAGTSQATDHSFATVTAFAWPQVDGPLWAVWANAGKQNLTLEVPTGSLTVTDIMGNSRQVKASDGVVSLELSTSPIYLTNGGALSISRRIETKITNGSTDAGQDAVKLTIKNNDTLQYEGVIDWGGQVTDRSSQPFSLLPGETKTVVRPVQPGLPSGERSDFSAQLKTSSGAVFATSASLNFATAAYASRTPQFDGTWDSWGAAPVITFGDRPEQVRKDNLAPNVTYQGTSDIHGKLRMLWDERYLYLGIEAVDDLHVAQPKRGTSGFMGDSIELGVQPDNIRAANAPYWEYELYLPGDGQGRYAASRRFPLPRQIVEHWKASVVPTGNRGDCVYQVAIPWADLGFSDPHAGKTFSLALVLNDCDHIDQLSGKRKRVYWFHGVDGAKEPSAFGDVTLVK